LNMGLNKGNRLVCGYTVARLVDEVDDAISTIEIVEKYKEEGIEEFAAQHIRHVKWRPLPAANALLKAMPHTCPGVDEAVVERMGGFLRHAEELLDKGEYKDAAGWLKTAKKEIVDLFWKD